MVSPTISGPSAAERIHGAFVHAHAAMLAVAGLEPVQTLLHHLRPFGDVVVAVPDDSPVLPPLADAPVHGVPAAIELTDYAPIVLREPVRSLVWLHGALRAVPRAAQRGLAGQVAANLPHPALLDVGHSSVLVRLTLESAVVADAGGAESADLDELRTAGPDPFWEWEAAWLQHLDADHPDVLDAMTRRLPPSLRGGVPRPLCIDRYGITLRLERPGGDHDVRLPFLGGPASDIVSLGRAVRALMGCPFRNGLGRFG
jgi:hypothetical protein